MPDLIGMAAFRLLEENFQERNELVVDGLAHVLAPHLPLPDEGR
jgi:hypothetical protein